MKTDVIMPPGIEKAVLAMYRAGVPRFAELKRAAGGAQ